MKKFVFLSIFLLFVFAVNAQPHTKWMISREPFLKAHDLSPFLKTDSLYGNNGVFGNDYGRLQIAFATVKKDPEKPAFYHVTGASRHKKNVNQFAGDLIIDKIYQYPGDREIYTEDPERMVASDTKPDKAYTIIEGRFRITEDTAQQFSGQFIGTFKLKLHELKDGSLINDLRNYEGAQYSNAIFQGNWRTRGLKEPVKAVWAEGRIPVPEGVDTGTNEFTIAKEYEEHGWKKDESGKYADNPTRWWIKKKKK